MVRATYWIIGNTRNVLEEEEILLPLVSFRGNILTFCLFYKGSTFHAIAIDFMYLNVKSA